MAKIRDNTYGKRPYVFRDSKTESINQEAYVNTYTLCTGDWFEFGTESAYSLHLTERDAIKFKQSGWWSATERARQIYVSKKTLEAISRECKNKGSRSKTRGLLIQY